MGFSHRDEQLGFAHQTNLEPCEPDMVFCPVFVVLAADQHCSTSPVGGNVYRCPATAVGSVHPYGPPTPTQ